ncbi:MAG: hypothetical protein Q8922_05705 [Bacteroidota bacterium]|nr:hypothetical protein [Bacteroidota bacterium]MDP4233101.1 hypothetical protein [Bacteroidota bacterium]MDP4241754.1 hypothetical protein [Bacteroidota bacterium]MDP4287412.1 hypothetical protein [Bacteroidota bacterium]
MSSRLGPAERRWVLAISSLTFLLRAVMGLRSEIILMTRPYIEDAYYALNCSWHISQGHGFSVDGIHPTNGVQPLITLLYAPFFFFTGDRLAGLRLTYILQGLIVASGCYLLAEFVFMLRRSDRSRPYDAAPVIAAAVWGLAISCFNQNTNGLETGLTISLIIACFLNYEILSRSRSLLRAFGFGVLLGLTVLARIDAAILIVIIAIYDLAHNKWAALRSILVYLGVALVITAPWWIYNLAVFHNLMPTSGQLESLHRPYAENFRFFGNALFDYLTVFYYHFYRIWQGWVTVVATSTLLALWILTFRLPRMRSWIRQQYDFRPLTPLLIFSVFLIVYYTLFFSAAHFLDRYLTPLRLIIVILFSVGASAGTAIFRHRALRACALAGAFAAILFSALHYYGLFAHAAILEDFYWTGRWAAVQQGSFGMMQTGLTGFIAPNVINLDGKVNADALEAQKKGNIAQYIIDTRIQYVADWADWVKPIIQTIRQRGVTYDSVRTIGSIVIYARR